MAAGAASPAVPQTRVWLKWHSLPELCLVVAGPQHPSHCCITPSMVCDPRGTTPLTPPSGGERMAQKLAIRVSEGCDWAIAQEEEGCGHRTGL